ncbi:DNA excision repair protein ERCC-6-like [Penaeus indicus]|uniref:DNA excision repair protein ERCC-6-like n=1 Tax=Penaeus indicus TaxID=29960 RepID=UPI00300D4929
MMETQGRTILVPAGVAESTRNSTASNPEEEKEVVFNPSSILSSLLTRDRDAGTSESRAYGAADQDLQDQDDELRALGISVVDQLSLERDVEAAVDQAVAKHSRKQRFQILKKEIKDVKTDIKQAENKLLSLRERLAGMRQRVVDPRQVISVEKEISNKSNQLKTLRAREKSLQQKLISAEANEEELDDLDLEDGEIPEDEDNENDGSRKEPRMSELEREKLIREGKMTPFGTVMSQNSSKTVSVLRPAHTPMEKRMAAEALKKKAASGGPSKADMIKSGEMTPFGTVVKSKPKDVGPSKTSSSKPSGGMSDFEKYLKDQIDRQKQHSETSKGTKRKKNKGDPNYGFAKKRKKKPKEFIGEYYRDDEEESEENDSSTSLSAIKKQAQEKFEAGIKKKEKSSKKDPLKMKILHPKKKRNEKNLGSVTSEREVDLLKETPQKILSEKVAFNEGESDDPYHGDGSGSEYRPTDSEGEACSDEYVDSCGDDEIPESSKRKSIRIDKKEKKQRKRKDDEWSDDNEFDDAPRRQGRKTAKERDDGNIEDYIQRIEAWKEERLRRKQAKILQGGDLDSEEEEEEGYEEFDGGYRIPLGVWNKLFKYQRTCVKWLWELHNQGCGGILGDEMGLGKTIQIISFLIGLSYSRLSCRRQSWKGLGPVLIVCPATVLHQWVKEFHKWWPPFRVAVLHESGCFAGKRGALIHNINQHDGILVTSYTGVLAQLEILLQYNWHYIILDEGHKIRNPEAQITVAMKRFCTPHRLILSGSPIQNSLKELWSLFDFIFPGKLGTLPVFLQQFAVPITQGGYANASKLEVQTAFKCASMLRDTINPYLLRRMKCDVRSHLKLPDKNEQVLFCDLTEAQRQVYRSYIDGDQVKCILGGRMKVFVGLIALRKICNHPDLQTGGPRNYDDQFVSGLQPELQYGWWGRSGKMHVLQSILKLWAKQGHRVLLFTQSRQMMCILEKFLMDEHHTYLKMDGTTAVASRQVMIDKYNSDPSYFVFLLTTRVGGLGVNLTGADRVIIFDPDWNPSTDSQARERSWRIGQTRHVTIYRLLTAGTIEEKIYHRQIFKQFLTNRVLKDPKQQRFFKTNDLYELFSLNEGIKEKTESSAIFAGTGSEIKVNTQDKNDGDKSDDDDEETSKKGERRGNKLPPPPPPLPPTPSKRESKPSHSRKNSQKEPKDQKRVEDNSKSNPKMPTKEKDKPVDDKVERMRELAKLLSKKIGQKTSIKEEKKDVIKSIENNQGVVSGSENVNESQNCSKKESDRDSQVITTEATTIKQEPEAIIEEVETKEEVESVTGEKEDSNIKEEDPHSDNIKKEIDPKDIRKRDSDDGVSSESREGSQGSSGNGDYFAKKRKDRKRESHSDSTDADRKHDSKDHERHRRKHKKEKKDKHKSRDKSKKKGKKFEGERIDFLVKKRVYQKTEEEEQAERESAKSQDQYVLEKLFKKSGVHTALSHDAIMSNGDPDYLLVESEAERVAKEALKAVRASRARCFRPQLPAGPSEQQSKSKPRFGTKKSSIFSSTDSETKPPKEEKKKEKKPHVFDGGMDEEDEEDETDAKTGITGTPMSITPSKKGKGFGQGKSSSLSSSQLLQRMRQRNRGMGMESEGEDSDGYDPDYPSTAPVEEEVTDPEVKENIDLLADIRNFVAFQARVDGKASTQEILDRFQERLPAEQTPFFKALLTEICDFQREAGGEGLWILKGEFR